MSQHLPLPAVMQAANDLTLASQSEFDSLPTVYIGALLKLRNAIQEKLASSSVAFFR